MLYDTDNSSDETQAGSSESDDDIETLLLDTLLTPNRELGPRLNLQDIKKIDYNNNNYYVKRGPVQGSN